MEIEDAILKTYLDELKILSYLYSDQSPLVKGEEGMAKFSRHTNSSTYKTVTSPNLDLC